MVLVLLSSGMTAGGASAGPVVSAVAPIRLKATTFSPASGEGPNLPPGLTIAGYATSQRGYYIVQSAGQVVPLFVESRADARDPAIKDVAELSG